ncbi:ROK family protein [Consotaella salsifontis]|uniref:Sugar kinase of the NBD/HSP70 family, may contain an N-terminal HTH domain n=1 Tax=Consotaella salsifontis TaxID=1365950 RepID=A0A1T4SGC3_9HYPH|nr:ROK family protein [Consotaella salsifontis]SKA27247.1 Sugar kinase of the NBD/HSP70 family, may contain an N-terminal HTH domain [Consotaella salsifontis]
MSAAIAELERAGYAMEVGAVQGALGRSAVQYQVGRNTGHVLAVDAGSTHVRVRVSTLDRRLLYSRIGRLPGSQFVLNEAISHAVSEEVHAALAQTREAWGPLQALGIALPTHVIRPNSGVEDSRQRMIFSAFEPPEGVEVLLENNVNCAAVAEQHYGAAQGRTTFAYVQIGLKIGMGLMIGGHLVSGFNGTAGEIGHLSFPFAPGLAPEPGLVERYLGAESWIARVRDDWPVHAGPPPETPVDLLGAAEAGNHAAIEHVERHAADIGALIATCVSVLDPGLVVMGGGVGASALLLPKLREVVGRLTFPVELQTTALGGDATILGIEKLTIARVLSRLIGAER